MLATLSRRMVLGAAPHLARAEGMLHEVAAVPGAAEAFAGILAARRSTRAFAAR